MKAGAASLPSVWWAGSASLLSEWWTEPDPAPVSRWLRSGGREEALKLWCELRLPGGEILENLYAALAREKDSLRQEYERLFVGPGPVPCPPYEAVWRADRPRHEQGTVSGQSTEEVLGLYASLGLQVRSGSPELPDHAAVELEALAYAWQTGASPSAAKTLVQSHLAQWFPAFCASVGERTESDFYRGLAALTAAVVRTWAKTGVGEV